MKKQLNSLAKGIMYLSICVALLASSCEPSAPTPTYYFSLDTYGILSSNKSTLDQLKDDIQMYNDTLKQKVGRQDVIADKLVELIQTIEQQQKVNEIYREFSEITSEGINKNSFKAHSCPPECDPPSPCQYGLAKCYIFLSIYKKTYFIMPSAFKGHNFLMKSDKGEIIGNALNVSEIENGLIKVEVDMKKNSYEGVGYIEATPAADSSSFGFSFGFKTTSYK